MHKNFYASGFIFHPTSGQILLQQISSDSPSSPSWELIGGSYQENEKPEESFKDMVSKLLDVEVKVVRPIYSYLNDVTGEFQYIVYSKLSRFKNFSSKTGPKFEWFSFKDVLKLKIAEQTKHDIIVGQRVIEAAGRKSRGEHTFQ